MMESNTGLDKSLAREVGLSNAEGGRTALVISSSDTDEGYKTAGKKELLPSRGTCEDARKVRTRENDEGRGAVAGAYRN